MAARIISVTFETTTQARSGSFSIPRSAANLLAIGADDRVQLRITWEGGKLELDTDLRSGWEVYPRSSDSSTRGLEAIPSETSITVTVWGSAEGAVEPDHQLTETHKRSSDLGRRYQRLFTGILARFQELRPGVTARARVGPENWLDFSAGRSGFLFSWSTAQNKYFRAELYIDVGDQATNKAHFDMLRLRASELEERLGLPISWERLDSKRASRLSVYHDVPGEDFDTNPELVEWAAQTMARLVDVMRPVVKSL